VVKDGKSLSQPQVVSYGRFIIGFPAAEMDATSPPPFEVGGLTTTWSFKMTEGASVPWRRRRLNR
jgi:hypothetical protein